MKGIFLRLNCFVDFPVTAQHTPLTPSALLVSAGQCIEIKTGVLWHHTGDPGRPQQQQDSGHNVACYCNIPGSKSIKTQPTYAPHGRCNIIIKAAAFT